MDDEARAGGPPEGDGLRRVFFGGAALVALGLVVALAIPRRVGPPPEEIADDPLLVTGREVYVARCISCHGERGRGDGPIAASIGPVKPRSFLEAEWKHGERPDRVVAVIREGVPGTDMAAWKDAYSEAELRAAAAYVLHLGGREVPEELRGPNGTD